MTSLEHSIDVYDPSADQWMPRIDMGINRHQGSTVLLPDSRVLLIAGHNEFGLNPGYAQYLHPADGFSLTSGSVEIQVLGIAGIEAEIIVSGDKQDSAVRQQNR